MTTVRMAHWIVALGLATAMHAQRNGSVIPKDYPYSPAFVSTISAGPGRTELVVFPPSGSAQRIRIRSAAGPFVYSADGKKLYGQCTPDMPSEPSISVSVCKIDLKTGDIETMPGSRGFYTVGLAVSNREDRLLVSGLYRQGRDIRGLFELPLGGKVRLLLLQSDNNVKSSWTKLSLSPDGKRAVALHNGRLEMINIVSGAVEPLQEDLFIADWSPDGKWLAAVENGENRRTILMDANDLTRRRVLGNSELEWSPDSRYLLGMRPSDRCGPYSGTLEVIDVESGERTAIKSSECQINQATTGWVHNDILQREKNP